MYLDVSLSPYFNHGPGQIIGRGITQQKLRGKTESWFRTCKIPERSRV